MCSERLELHDSSGQAKEVKTADSVNESVHVK